MVDWSLNMTKGADLTRTTLILDLRPGERLKILDAVTVELVQKSGQLARLRTTAPADVKIEKVLAHQQKACQA